MPLREITPCDFEGICPYGADSWGQCVWFCGEPDESNDDDYDESEE